MVPDSGSTSGNDGSRRRSAVESDGGVPAMDEATLYRVVREAVTDALFDVIGTLMLVGLAFVLLIAGVQWMIKSGTTLGLALGAAMTIVAISVAAAALEIIPPIREWF